MRSVKPLDIGRVSPVTFTILTQPQSKANSRRLVVFKGRIASIKSKKALEYVKHFAMQAPKLDPLFLGPVKVELDIYYASRRPDLDESLILDCCQGCIYLNDRQVVEKHIFKHLDINNPRCRMRVSAVESGPWAGDHGHRG